MLVGAENVGMLVHLVENGDPFKSANLITIPLEVFLIC